MAPGKRGCAGAVCRACPAYLPNRLHAASCLLCTALECAGAQGRTGRDADAEAGRAGAAGWQRTCMLLEYSHHRLARHGQQRAGACWLLPRPAGLSTCHVPDARWEEISAASWPAACGTAVAQGVPRPPARTGQGALGGGGTLGDPGAGGCSRKDRTQQVLAQVDLHVVLLVLIAQIVPHVHLCAHALALARVVLPHTCVMAQLPARCARAGALLTCVLP